MDEHHEISNASQARGWLELFVNKSALGLIDTEDSIYSHPKGYFQPGVLSLDSNGRILYRWRSVPTRKNMGGATERPTSSYIFDKVTEALSNKSTGGGPAGATLDTNPRLDSRGLPWPIFVSLLTANGWFIKPKPFPYLKGGPSVGQRSKSAIIRIPFFVAAWVIALITLPGIWVGSTLVVYALWLTPHIRYINQQFQNEKVL